MKVIQLTAGGVFHAIQEKKGRGILVEDNERYKTYNYNPNSEWLKVACKYGELEVDDIRVKDGEVTCAACRKKLKLDPITPSCKRYVLVDTRINKFYKKSRNRFSDEWITDLLSATLYKASYVPYWAKGKDHYKMKELCIYLEG